MSMILKQNKATTELKTALRRLKPLSSRIVDALHPQLATDVSCAKGTLSTYQSDQCMVYMNTISISIDMVNAM